MKRLFKRNQILPLSVMFVTGLILVGSLFNLLITLVNIKEEPIDTYSSILTPYVIGFFIAGLLFVYSLLILNMSFEERIVALERKNEKERNC